MIKICYIVTIPETIKAFFIPQLKYLSNHGYDVTVICNDDPDLKRLLGNKIKFYPVEIPREISIKRLTKAIGTIKRIFIKNKYDIVQYSTLGASVAGAIAAILSNIKIRNYHVMGFRFVDYKGVKRLFHKTMEIVPCILSTDIECVSKSNYEMAIKEKMFKRKKGTVVFNGSTGGIDLDRFNCSKREEYREEIRSKLGLQSTDYIFGYVGRVCKDKGIEELYTAFNKTLEEKKDIKLLIVGDLSEKDTLNKEMYVQSLKNKSIIYVGQVKDVEKYYCAIDVLLLPTYHEGFGNVIIEAAAMGTPAIVSGIPGPIDASVKNKTALWIKPHSYISLFNAMHKIIGHEVRMSQECINFAQDSFDQNKLNTFILNRKNALLKNICKN